MPNEDSDMRDFGGLLSSVRQLRGVPWCFGGDFNLVYYPPEKKGGRRMTRSMETFSEFINDNEL